MLRRAETMLQRIQISSLGTRGIYRVLSKMDEFESTFSDPFLVFPDVPNSHFLLVFTVFFQRHHFLCVKKARAVLDPPGCV